MKADKFKRDPDKALRISKLEVDADKDFEGMGINNLKGISNTMDIGDVVFRGPTVLRPLPPGMVGYVLVSSGPAHSPYWAPISSSGDKWISAPLYLSMDSVDVMGYLNENFTGEIDVLIESANYILMEPDLVKTLDGTSVETVAYNEAAAGAISALCTCSVA